ncbi:MAG TPA: hypothetical protein VEC19_01925 [Usitatibacter sp.]|nr:hypothetical protein [Usitatibacter sp.]
MAKTLFYLCACALLGTACAFPVIDTDMSPGLRKAQRPTGSNIARMTRDPDLEGWRQGFDRDAMRQIQAARPLTMEGGGNPVGGKANWYK